MGWSSIPEYEVDPYANLKIRYEQLLRLTCDCIVVYPYATSGSYISDVEAFAISSFIKQALVNNKIHINADMLVVRSYSSAHDFSKLLLKFSELAEWDRVPKSFVPVTHTLELQQLAIEISAALSLDIPIIRPQISAHKKSSIYAATVFDFPVLMAHWGLVSTPLSNQIRGMAADILGN